MSEQNGTDINRPRISRLAASIEPAPTLAIAAKAKRMRAEGIDVVSFSTGEPDFDTPSPIAEAGVEAIRSGFTHYTDARGIPELREAVATMFTEEYGVTTDPDRTLVSAGGKQSIFFLLAAILDPGDEVIVQAPYWVSYPSMVRLNGGVPRIVDTTLESSYKMSSESLRGAINGRSRCLILNSPCNPTGTMYSEEEIRELVGIAVDHGLYVLSDELYAILRYDDHAHFSPGSVDAYADHILTVNGVSKAWAMTGWRIGFATGPADVLAAAGAMQSQVASNPCSISQKAALLAVRDGHDAAVSMKDAFDRRRKLMASKLDEIPDLGWTMPAGAFYFFVDCAPFIGKAFGSTLEIAASLLETEAVAIVPGEAFGAPTGFRLSYACSDEDIVRGMDRLSVGLKRIATANAAR